ncbi:MAG TPA: endonuclease/exonuclease/phosphatase family protein [Xanthobacteraceae bacterium]|jgi:endonuclease/exonuclease/phosphatase family metal-dependent hydrolase
MNLRVLTLNVWNDEGNGSARTKLINREIRRLKPDLVSFQEVVRKPDFGQLAHLIDGTGLHGTHQADLQPVTPPFFDRYGGGAVASRWPHQPLEVLDLRLAGANDVPWATLAVSVVIPDLGEMLFIVATASWRLNAEHVRERQALALADLDARHRKTLPTIIAGDFNAAPDAASIRFLTGRQSLDSRSVHYHDAWDIAGEGPGHTWTTANPNAKAGIDRMVRQPKHARRLDYVFIGGWDAHPAASAHVKAAALVLDSAVGGLWASDHFGLLVDIEVGKSG